jgi:hypothetical protein
MLHVRRQQNSRLYAAVEPAALLLSTTTLTKSSGWRGKQRESRRHSGQPRIPMGARVAAAQIGADAPTTLRARAHAAAAQTGVDTPAVLPAAATEWTEIAASTGGATLPPRISTMVTTWHILPPLPTPQSQGANCERMRQHCSRQGRRKQPPP